MSVTEDMLLAMSYKVAQDYVERLESENAKLRKENDTLMRRIDELCMENEKLRELVKEMRVCLKDECKRCHEWGYTCDLEHQMRELEVSGDE